jgi:hypothetical protein
MYVDDAFFRRPESSTSRFAMKCKAVGITPGPLWTTIRIRPALRLLDVFSSCFEECLHLVFETL